MVRPTALELDTLLAPADADEVCSNGCCGHLENPVASGYCAGDRIEHRDDRSEAMDRMKRILLGSGAAVAIFLAACADLSAPGSGESPSPLPSDGSQRVDVYEILIRRLADPEGSQPIYVVSDLCFNLMQAELTCPDDLSRDEQQELAARLQDLGDIVFRRNDEPRPSPEEPFQEILLGPIVERPDGLRVEGGAVCGILCGTGAVYVLVETDGGYEVTGTDDTFGSWIG